MKNKVKDSLWSARFGIEDLTRMNQHIYFFFKYESMIEDSTVDQLNQIAYFFFKYESMILVKTQGLDHYSIHIMFFYMGSMLLLRA